MAELLTPTMNGATMSPAEIPFSELGTSGLRQYGGFVREEFLQQLSGPRGMRVFREMRDNDAIIGASLFAIEMLIRRAEWRLVPADATQAAAQMAETVSGMLFEDMSQSWTSFLSEALTFLPFGWALCEIVYKRREGPTPPPGRQQDDTWAPSRFADGLIGFRKLPLRAQDTLLKWVFDAHGGLAGMVQQDPVATRQVTIPIQKALLFRGFAWKGNPEGRSVIRNAYRSWYMKTRLENIEGIGVERDLAGLPVGLLPVEMFSRNLAPEQQAALAAFKNVVRNIRRDEQEGILWPLAYDDKGNKKYDLTLLSTGGSRQFDTNRIIERYDTRILQSVLADVIMVGQNARGSQSLAETKNELFLMALSGFLDSIADVFMRHAFPRLFALNGWPPALQPRLVYSDLKEVDFEKFTSGIKNLAQAGFVLSPEDEAHVRAEIGFPAMVEEMLS